MSKVWFGTNPPVRADDWICFDDAATVAELRETVENAEELWIDDPFEFPWDSLDATISAPATVVIDTTSLVKLAAFEPWLRTLGPGDRIVSPNRAIERHFTEVFSTDDPDDARPLELRAKAKRLATARAEIELRLTTESLARGDHERLAILTLTRDDIVLVDSPDFAATITEITANLGPGKVCEVWGLRQAPGAELEGAVIGFLLDTPVPAQLP